MALPPFGNPSDSLYEDLDAIPHRVKIAWHDAQAHPEKAEEILAEAANEVRRVALVAQAHLRGAVERAQRKGDSYKKARESAERYLENQLASLHATALAVEPLDPHGFYVYCLWGDDQQCPLYVGCSTNVLARLGTHLSDRDKRPQVRAVTLTECATERDMRRQEERLVSHYQPPMNIVGIRKGVA